MTCGYYLFACDQLHKETSSSRTTLSINSTTMAGKITWGSYELGK